MNDKNITLNKQTEDALFNEIRKGINENTISNENAQKVFNTLSTVDSVSTEALKKAHEETESTDYTENEKMETDTPVVGVDNIQPSIVDYNEVFKDYNIHTKDVNILFSLIDKYKRGENINYYNHLPESIKAIADGIRSMSDINGVKMGKNVAAKYILNEFIHDAKMNNAFNTYFEEMSEAMIEMNEGYKDIISKSFDETFKRINEIEAENPEQAEKIRLVKKAFDDAITFERQLEYVEKISASKLTKFTNRYNSETAYFNNLVNTTDVKIPDIRQLSNIIFKALPQFSINDINKFIITICKTSYDLNMNNIVDLAYTYKMISSIYEYKFTNNYISKEAEELFGNIAKVITAIINK